MITVHLTTIEVDKLEQAKRLHALDSWGGRWCETCIESGSMDSERQVWPCDTAELLYTPEEIARILLKQRADQQVAYEAYVAKQRAEVDSLWLSSPDSFWELVEQTSKPREPSLIEKLWSKEISFQATPVLRYSRVVAADGSVDDHLQTGRYAR